MEEHASAVQTSYDRVAAAYAAHYLGELAYKPLDPALLDCFAEEVRGHGPVGGIGCGRGQVARYLHERGLTPIGIDLSAEMVAQARQHHPALTFHQGDMRALDVVDGAWAGLVALYAIVHLEPAQVRRALAEFYRVLQPGGLLLASGQDSAVVAGQRERQRPRRASSPREPRREPDGQLPQQALQHRPIREAALWAIGHREGLGGRPRAQRGGVQPCHALPRRHDGRVNAQGQGVAREIGEVPRATDAEIRKRRDGSRREAERGIVEGERAQEGARVGAGQQARPIVRHAPGQRQRHGARRPHSRPRHQPMRRLDAQRLARHRRAVAPEQIKPARVQVGEAALPVGGLDERRDASEGVEQRVP